MLQIEVRGKVVTAQPQRKFYFAVNKPKVGNALFGSFCLDLQLALVLVLRTYTTWVVGSMGSAQAVQQ